MRRVLLCVQMMTLLLLTAACNGAGARAEELALELRAQYLAMGACSLTADISADYGNRVYPFSVTADYRKDGESTLAITAPELLSGVQFRYAEGGAVLSYDGAALETGRLSPSGLSPLGALPALLDACRNGGMTECGFETFDEMEVLRITCADDMGGESLARSIWFHPVTGAPLRAEIALDGYTVITCEFTSFSFEAG